MDLRTTATNMIEESRFGVIACEHNNEFVIAAKGDFPTIAYLIARTIYACHKDNGVPLEEFGNVMNLAMKSIIEAEEGNKNEN